MPEPSLIYIRPAAAFAVLFLVRRAALSLRNMLANFLAAIHILLKEPISVGDFTRTPNTKITFSILVNHCLPQIPILGGHTADPDFVARIAIEEAHEASGLLPAHAPALFFHPGVTLSPIQFRLDVAVPNKPRAGSIQSQLRVALLRHFRREGFPLPEIRRIEMLGA
jgi:hypothetical protein